MDEICLSNEQKTCNAKVTDLKWLLLVYRVDPIKISRQSQVSKILTKLVNIKETVTVSANENCWSWSALPIGIVKRLSNLISRIVTSLLSETECEWLGLTLTLSQSVSHWLTHSLTLSLSQTQSQTVRLRVSDTDSDSDTDSVWDWVTTSSVLASKII